MAADKVEREQIYIPREQIRMVTAPGLYNVPSTFQKVSSKNKIAGKTTTQRLKDMGIYQ